ncbi:MAG: hypothetical protein KC912_16720 [Proteobacteria bacterium]|nr:hypothetical protein [Pseudomonadota bacterium]
MANLVLLALTLLFGTAHADEYHFPNAPPLGDLPSPKGQTTFYFDVTKVGGTDIRVFHDGERLDVEVLGACILPGDEIEHACFRAVSKRTGLVTLRVDVLSEGKWKAGDEILVGVRPEGAAVVIHLPHWLVYTYASSSGGWAVGLGGEWSLCRAGRALPAPMWCPDGHWAFPTNDLLQVEVQHADGPIRRSVIPIASGIYTFYRSGKTIWGDLKELP